MVGDGEVADRGTMQRVMVPKGPRVIQQTARDYLERQPTQPPLPDWLEIRDHQLDATEQVVKEFEGGARVVFLDAPTGVGKTIIGELVRRRLNVERGLYVCTTKSLQEQVARDFGYARVLKGRANYTPTQLSRQERGYEGGGRWGGVAITCGDCDRGPRDAPIEEQSCSYCEVLDCPYLRARYEASVAPVGVLNTAFMLTHLNGGGRRAPSPFRDRELVVADECDLIEDELLGYVEFRLGSGVAATLGVEVPKKGSHMTTIRAWLGEEVIAAIDTARKGIKGGGLEALRQRRRLDQLMQDARRVIEREEGWVREGDEEGDRGGAALVLKPVEVSDVGERYLWQHGERWLCMSGTVVSADTLADSLGLTEAEVPWSVVSLDMRFAKEHRKVVFMPAGSMTRKGQEQGGAVKVFGALDRVLAQHPTGNVLVHTFSYALARDAVAHLGNRDEVGDRPVITYNNARDRDDALAAFKAAATQQGAVMVASSMGRGIDLPGDLCRCQVILKMPHASLGSRQVSERLKAPGGQDWYLANTVRTVLQQCGRAVRGDEDWATTYILDASFSKVLKDGKRRGMFPQWWLDALSLGRLR